MSEATFVESSDASFARVERSFAFVDLSGFTTFTDLHGDDEAVDLLSGFRSAVRRVSGRHGVRVAKWLGDGAMVVGVEAADLMHAIVDLESAIDANGSALPMRGGLGVGPVLLFEGDDYIGKAVNLAARLCDLASPHELLAMAEFAPHAPETVQVHPLGEHEVPGFARAVPLVRLELSGSH